MKVECEKNKLEPAIQKAARLASKHLTLPVLNCVYLEALPENKLIVKATNLDIGVEIDIKVKTIAPGSAAIPANVLISFLASIKENDLVLESKENNLKISAGKNSVVIKSMPSDDFPSIPKLSAKDESGEVRLLKINSKDFILGLKSVWYSASNSNIKPELSSIYIYRSDSNLTFVSTDSFRLAEKKINTKLSSDFPQTLIPYKNVVEIIKLFDDYNGDIEVIFDKNQTAFMVSGMYIVSRLIDGSFPDYNQIIPKSFITSATVLKNDFINSIKTSNIFSDSFNQVKLRVDVRNKSLNLESKNNEVGESQEAISASISGSDIELNFNSKYILDCMQSIPSDSIILNFGGIGKPLVINGNSDKSFLYIVMPMNR